MVFSEKPNRVANFWTFTWSFTWTFTWTFVVLFFYCLKNFSLSISEFGGAYLDICRDTFLCGTWMVKFLFRGPLCHQCSFQNESINVE